MRHNLPKKPRYIEDGIVNLDLTSGNGTHWVAYKKRGNRVICFDSFGNLSLPRELIRYFGMDCDIRYNYKRYQKINSFNCGHLCLQFLKDQ